jgi:hypothetical protein
MSTKAEGLISLLKSVQIRSSTRRPRSKPEQVYADNKYHTPSVMMYFGSRGIAASIQEHANKKEKRKKRPDRNYCCTFVIRHMPRSGAASRDSLAG